MKILYTAHNQTLMKKLYTLADDALKAQKKLLVIVPAQASFLVEKGIMQHCGVAGFIDIEVASFEKLTERVTGFVGGRTLMRVDGPGFAMLAKLAMQRLSEDALQVLNRKDPVLHEKVASLIWALKAEDISAEQLSALAAKSAGFLGQKLADIALIYAGMQSIAGGTMFDTQDMEAFVSAKFAETEYITKQDVLIYGFDILPKRRLQTVLRLAKTANSVTMLMQAEPSETHQKQWDTIDRLCRHMQEYIGDAPVVEALKEAPMPDEIAVLFQNLYAYPYMPFLEEPQRIHLTVAQDRKKEIRHVAQQILSLTCEQGFAMDDIAVVAGNTSTHAMAIKEVFGQAQIPFFLENKRAVLDSVVATFILALLRILSGGKWRRQDVFELLKTGFCCTEQEADALIAYGKEYGQKGYRYKSGLKNAPEELSVLQQHIFVPIAALESATTKPEFIQAMLRYLEELHIEEKTMALAAQMEAAGFAAQARYYEQVYPAAIETLAQAEMLSGIAPEELVGVIEAGFKAKMISVVPPMTNEVLIADATHSIIGNKKVIFAVGVNDRLLPLVPDEAGVITSVEALFLRQEVPSFPDAMGFEDQKPYMRTFLTQGEHLFVSYNLEDGQASYLIDRIKRLFPLLKEANADDTLLRSKEASMTQLALQMQNVLSGRAEPTSLMAMYLAQEKEVLAELLARTRYTNIPVPIEQGLAHNLYGSLRASISSVEQYYSCPYQHFIRYGMRPKEIEVFEENALQVGNYVHDLMEDFTAALSVQKKNWADVSDNEVEMLIDKAAEARIPLHNKGIFEQKEFAFTEKRLREEAVLAAKAVRTQVKNTGVDIVAGEQSFGGNIFTLNTAYGALTMRGRIDRVDIATGEEEAYLRVVDYKSGNKTFDLTEAYYGLSIQLIVYLLAAQSRLEQMYKKKITPAGGFYFTIHLPYIEEGEDEQKRQVAFRMDGFLLASAQAAQALDPDEGKLLSMKAEIKEEELKDAKNIFSPEVLQNLFAHTKALIVEAAEKIYGGEIAISPMMIHGQMPCRYCEYQGICLLEDDATSTKVRYAKKIEKEMLEPEGAHGEI